MAKADGYPFEQRIDVTDPFGLAAPLTAGLVRDSLHDEMDGDTRLVDLQNRSED